MAAGKISDVLLDRAEEKFGKNHIVSIYGNRRMSVQDYKDAVERTKGIFDAESIKMNTVAIIIMNDTPCLIKSFLACISYGLVPVIFSDRTRIGIINHFIDRLSPSVIISNECLDCINRDYTLIGDDESFSVSYYKRISEKESSKYIDASENAYLSLTSGSSGMPKLVRHGHVEMLYASKHYAINTLNIKDTDVLFSLPKMNFTYGLANSLFFSLYSGASAILDDLPFSTDRCFSYVREFHPTYFFAVPTIYQMILDSKRKMEGFDSIKYFISAGELLPKNVIDEWEACTGKRIIDTVGCSETGSAFLANIQGEEKIGSAGRIVDGYQVFLGENPSKNEDKQGVLFVKSRSNALGYFEDADAEKEKFIDGWIRTGDIFRVDDEGYYWFIGREDNLIKYHGMWVDVEEINSYIRTLPGVKNAVTFRNEFKGRTGLVSVLVVDDGFEGTSKIKVLLRSKYEKHKCPEIIRTIEDIPRNINGKTDLNRIREIIPMRIVTVDGMAKLGKSTLADRIADEYGVEHINVGIYFRFLAWYLERAGSSVVEITDKDKLIEVLAKLGNRNGRYFFNDEDITLHLKGPIIAMKATELGKNDKLQKLMNEYLRHLTCGRAVVVDGRNMGSEVFKDADVKLFLKGSPQKRVRYWCQINGYGEREYQEGLADLLKRNCIDATRKTGKVEKADDAYEICIDDKTPEQVYEEAKIIIDKTYEVSR